MTQWKISSTCNTMACDCIIHYSEHKPSLPMQQTVKKSCNLFYIHKHNHLLYHHHSKGKNSIPLIIFLNLFHDDNEYNARTHRTTTNLVRARLTHMRSVQQTREQRGTRIVLKSLNVPQITDTPCTTD